MKTLQSIISPSVAVEHPSPPSSDAGTAGDRALFVRFIDGDDGAFMELFSRHASRLFIYCLKFVHDRQQAHDIMQDVWERMLRFRSERKAPPDNPLGLLLRTVHNLALNHIRDHKGHLSLDDMPDWRQPASPTRDMSEMEEMVVAALDRLPIHLRRVLVLHAYSGYQYDEIAAMLGEPAGAIRTRAWRARTHLARLIAAMLGMEGSDDQTNNDIDAERGDQGEDHDQE
jgi:RNA polymerase sigma-70 factor (ECF subfamily)